jgi:diguanylate cyclase (GGDEF)-like protein
MTEGITRLEAAGRHAREQLRRSAATRRSLLELVATSCLAELAKLGRVEELDLAGFLTGVVEILVQFLPLSEAVVTVAFEGAPPLVARAGRGGVGAVPAEHDLVVQDGVVGSLRLVGRGLPVEPTFVGAVAAEVSGRLGAVLDRERVRRRGLGADTPPPLPAAAPNAPATTPPTPATSATPATTPPTPAISAGSPGDDGEAASMTVLNLLAGTAPLSSAIGAIARLVIELAPGAAAILLADPSGTVLRLGASAGLDRSEALVLDGLAVSRSGSPSGRALWRSRTETDRSAGPAVWPEDLIRDHLGAAETVAVPVSVGARPGAVLLLWPRDDDASAKAQAVMPKMALLCAIALQRHHDAAEIARHASFDRLTGLANRDEILERAATAIARSRRVATSIAVLVLDLDRFKVINDSMGHEIGDRLLVAVGERLRRSMRPGDSVGRLGADEFAVVCEDVGGEYQAADIASHLGDVIARPFAIAGHEVFLTGCIGIAVASGSEPDGGGPYALAAPADAATALLRDADAATARAKAIGPNHRELFDPSTRDRLIERLEIHNGLRRAIEDGDLALLFQPEVELGSGRIVGVEALVRWQHPRLGMVAPSDFIPAAEESGLIVPLGEWVLERACRQAARWEAERGAPLPVWVNLSGRHLSQPDLCEMVASTLSATGANPRALGLEITESAVMEDAESAGDLLRGLHRLGVGLAIDDFGTGYSSLAYLKRFTVDRLKVDRSFVSGIVTDPEDASIVAAVIQLAHVLGLDVVAEGVEDFEQAEALAGLGCVFAQGFLFARPQEADAISELLATGGRCVPGLRWGEAVPGASLDGPRVTASGDVALGFPARG